jgi:hypothetical protein
MTTQDLDDDTLFAGSVAASADVLKQELPDEETIFLNLKTESYFGLDPVGTKMYRALVDSPTVGAAYDRLAAQFDVDAARLRSDLRAFVRRLIDQGLIEIDAQG